MFLFILESLGTSELILIGILALVLLGPRKLPEIARKAGKMMAEFRGTAAEFKETWQKELDFEEESRALREGLNFEDEKKALSLENLDEESRERHADPPAPSIGEADPSRFEGLIPDRTENGAAKALTDEKGKLPIEKDKKNWL